MGIQQIPLSSGGATLAEITANLPSLAQINTSVANNASPFGGTWTQLANTNPNGSNLQLFSGLSGYKRYRVFLSVSSAVAFSMQMNLNAGIGLASYTTLINNASSTPFKIFTTGSGGSTNINAANSNDMRASYIGTFMVDILDASSSSYKPFMWTGQYTNTSLVDCQVYGGGFLKDTNPVSSIQFYSPGAFASSANTGFMLFGGN